MDDAPFPEDPSSLAPAEPATDIDLDVELVVPAAVYDTIATHEAGAMAAPIPLPTSHPAAQESPKALELIRELGETLGRKLDHMQTVFDREVRAEATRERVVDRLHAELQEYKQDLLLKMLRPVFVDLIQLHDDIGKMVDSQGEADGQVARLLEVMKGFQQGIEDILYRQGVEPFVLDEPAFDPRRQRAVATVATDDPGMNKVVAVRHRKGFQAGDKVIRPEIVSVYAVKR